MARPRKIVAPQASPSLQSVELNTENKLQKKIQDMDTPAHMRAIEKIKRRNDWITIADQVAENTLYFRNHKFKEADQVFPRDIDYDLRVVTKYYPYAKGGPLLVDEPMNEHEMLLAYEKQKALLALGYRHVVIEQDATLGDILEQLGAI